MPFVRPFTVTGTAVTAEPVIPPGAEVTTYPVIALPPLEVDERNLTVACPFPLTAVTAVGALGVPAAAGVTEVEMSDAGPMPTAFVALTVKV